LRGRFRANVKLRLTTRVTQFLFTYHYDLGGKLWVGLGLEVGYVKEYVFVPGSTKDVLIDNIMAAKHAEIHTLTHSPSLYLNFSSLSMPHLSQTGLC